MNSQITFNKLKFGHFTSEDINQRWITKDNSKFISLPIEIKLRWIDLMAERYRPVVKSDELSNFDKSVIYWKKVIKGEMAEDDFWRTDPISFFYSFYSFSFSSMSFFLSDFSSEIMCDLEKDAALLNQAIGEYD